MSTEVRVPTLGESVTEATVASWLKKAGDTVELDEILAELETDKVSVEVPSPVAGKIDEIVAEEGSTVEVDALLAMVSEGGESSGDSKAKSGGDEAKSGGGSKAEASKSADSGGDGGEDAQGDEVEIMVPTLGESVSEATIATWYKSEGDTVEADEPLCELETDKVSVEVPAPASGTITKLSAQAGDTVEAGASLGTMTRGGAGQPHAAQEGTPETTESPEQQGDGGPEPERRNGGGTTAGGSSENAAEGAVVGPDDVGHAPSALKLMEEKGLRPSDVDGTGRGGRIMKEDVQRALDNGVKPSKSDGGKAKSEASSGNGKAKEAPKAPTSADDAGREERVKMSRLRQTIAKRLKDAQNTAAMLTTYNEVDMTAVMDLRSEYKDLFEKKHGVKLGFMSFFAKACSHALKEVPEVNAELDGDEIVYKNFVHMGVAVGTPNGLVVPVVRDADAKSFAEIESEINALGKKARDGKLKMAEMQGGTFTMSNGGVYGSLMSSPILNPPQSGILGMHKIQERPMVIGGEIVIRPMMYLALSYDHRIVDGKGAVTFLVRVKEALEDPRRLLMDL